MKIQIQDASMEWDLSEDRTYRVLNISPRFNGFYVTVRDDEGDLQEIWSDNFEEVE